MGDVKKSSRPVSDEPRRGFLTKLLAMLFGGVVGLLPIVAGAVFFCDPLLRRRKQSADAGGNDTGFVRVTTLQALPSDGSPRLFPIVADKQDAWNKFPQTEVGSVYLRLAEGDRVECFNSRCPHLGCTVKFQSDLTAFVCPCHDSSFSLDGLRSNDIPPRDLDVLDAEIRNESEVWVRFEKFRAGIPEKIPV